MSITADRNQLIAAMASGKPVASFIKTILGKVDVTVWDVFQNMPVHILLEGDPRKREDGSYVDLYSAYEVTFFKRANKRHFELGNLVEFTHDEPEAKSSIESYTDDGLKDLLNSPFLKLQSALNSTESVAVLFRMEHLAKELEKSDKILNAIRSRISEIQQMEYEPDEKYLEE